MIYWPTYNHQKMTTWSTDLHTTTRRWQHDLLTYIQPPEDDMIYWPTYNHQKMTTWSTDLHTTTRRQHDLLTYIQPPEDDNMIYWPTYNHQKMTIWSTDLHTTTRRWQHDLLTYIQPPVDDNMIYWPTYNHQKMTTWSTDLHTTTRRWQHDLLTYIQPPEDDNMIYWPTYNHQKKAFRFFMLPSMTLLTEHVTTYNLIHRNSRRHSGIRPTVHTWTNILFCGNYSRAIAISPQKYPLVVVWRRHELCMPGNSPAHHVINNYFINHGVTASRVVHMTLPMTLSSDLQSTNGPPTLWEHSTTNNGVSWRGTSQYDNKMRTHWHLLLFGQLLAHFINF